MLFFNPKKLDKAKLFALIPTVFAAFTSASFVWHFSAEKTLFILALFAAFAFQLILFSVYDIARKPKMKFLFAVFIIAVLFLMEPIAMIYEQLMLDKADTTMDTLYFADWFFGSGSYMEYNPGNCCILLIVISLAIGSATYFYTKVYLRISVLFLLALFPPIIYAKDYESYPPIFCAALIALFMITVIYSNLTTGKNKTYNQQNNEKSKYPISVISFLAASILIALVIPKPDIEDKRSAFDDFTQGRFSSDYGRVVDNFTIHSNGNNTGNLTSQRELMRVGANELLNLKTQCYYYYDENKDSWTPLAQDEYYMSLDDVYVNDYEKYTFKQDGLSDYNPAELIAEIISVCNNNHEFAEKYNLTDLIGQSNDLNDYSQTIYYISVNQNFNPTYVLTPENAQSISISSCPEIADVQLFQSDSDTIYLTSGKSLIHLAQKNLIAIEYISPQIIYEKRTQIIMRALQYEDYGEFLLDLYSNSNSLVVAKAYERYQAQNKIFEEESERVFSKKIRDLGESITDGLYSDYEKAKAIEQYFTEQGYIYDTDYVCPKGKNITDFIFNTKRGSCYHYATAMTLLCRSVGLDARYCEGFSYSEEANSTNYFGTKQSYKISEGDSHAFCEVYISGYGWMRFEPTVADEGFKLGSLQLAALIAVIILGALLLTLLMVFVIYPIIEKLYIKHLAKSQQCQKLCRYIMKAINKRTKSPQSRSALDTAKYILNSYGFDIMPIAELFDSCIYGENTLDKNQMKTMIETYCNFRKLRKKSKIYTELELAL